MLIARLSFSLKPPPQPAVEGRVPLAIQEDLDRFNGVPLSSRVVQEIRGFLLHRWGSPHFYVEDVVDDYKTVWVHYHGSNLEGLMSPEYLAQQFRGVEYRVHQELFELLGREKIAQRFAEIWTLCVRNMDKPHTPSVLGYHTEHWARFLDRDFDKRRRFLDALCAVLEREAEGDALRGRTRLARLLRQVRSQIQRYL